MLGGFYEYSYISLLQTYVSNNKIQLLMIFDVVMEMGYILFNYILILYLLS